MSIATAVMSSRCISKFVVVSGWFCKRGWGYLNLLVNHSVCQKNADHGEVPTWHGAVRVMES